uniref:Uncharacterized protein n=1 Tax=Knipowitschia caucasica TaxID=637954 RepID=A0AAV2JP07_KNICA
MVNPAVRRGSRGVFLLMFKIELGHSHTHHNGAMMNSGRTIDKEPLHPWIWVAAVTALNCWHAWWSKPTHPNPTQKASPPVAVWRITGPPRAPANPFIIHTPLAPDQILPFCNWGGWRGGGINGGTGRPGLHPNNASMFKEMAPWTGSDRVQQSSGDEAGCPGEQLGQR